MLVVPSLSLMTCWLKKTQLFWWFVLFQHLQNFKLYCHMSFFLTIDITKGLWVYENLRLEDMCDMYFCSLNIKMAFVKVSYWYFYKNISRFLITENILSWIGNINVYFYTNIPLKVFVHNTNYKNFTDFQTAFLYVTAKL